MYAESISTNIHRTKISYEWVCCYTGAADNTRVALHFANAAKRVTMQPHVNEVVNQKALLRKLRDEVALLRKQLVSVCSTEVLSNGSDDRAFQHLACHMLTRALLLWYLYFEHKSQVFCSSCWCLSLMVLLLTPLLEAQVHSMLTSWRFRARVLKRESHAKCAMPSMQCRACKACKACNAAKRAVSRHSKYLVLSLSCEACHAECVSTLAQL